MNITISQKQSKWETPRLVEIVYPPKIKATPDRRNWIKAMMLDARLSDRDKVVLTRLAFHLNFKIGDLYPSLHLLALVSEDSSKRALRRSLEQAGEAWLD
jgi:hypothetical protein